jgi:PAS domain S-box-containing protein
MQSFAEFFEKSNKWASALFGVILLLTAGYIGMKNFLLFRTFTEGFTIVVSFSIVFIVINTYQKRKSDFIPIIGIAYAFAGVFDTLRTLAYRGIGVFPNDVANLPAQIWIIARYFDSIGMLVAGISFHRIIKPFYVLITYAVVSVLILLAVFHWHIFPVAFIDGQGLTHFKVYSEYVICLILVASVILLMRHRKRFQPQVYRPLLTFFLVSVFTELSFAFYKTSGGWEDVIGHLLKITAFFFLYLAIVDTSLKEPYSRVREQAHLLSSANRQMAEILTSISDGFLALDNDWRLIYVNPVTEKFCFRSKDELLGHRLWDFFPNAQPYYDQYHKAKRENVAVHFEAAAIGTEKWLEVHAYPSEEGLSVFFRDITEQKKYEAELSRLDRLNIVGEMAVGIGHEVRNPMTTVRGYLQMFQLKEKFTEYDEQISTMIEELDRANAIITEFLSLAKDKAVELVKGNLNNVLNALFPLLQADAFRAGHILEMETRDIPDVRLNESELRQLVLNLVRNGFEAMQSGGTLTIKSYLKRGRIVLAICDTGTGIPEQVLEKLGTPFMTTKETGTGLGLAVCYRIAERHGAKIDFKTSAEGTTFFVIFD